MHQMFDTLLVALAVSVALFVGYLLLKAYKPEIFSTKATFIPPSPPAHAEPFVAAPPPPTAMNTAPPPVPAPAPPQRADPPQEPRVVSPGGPNPPNAAPPADAHATLSPEAKPLDPYEDRNMTAPIQDSMRHPEMSFGPGVDNTGMNRLATTGVGSTRAAAAESPFSPEMAQNGGSFMNTVFANDLQKGDSYASA
jgi:hypothetical protein